MYTPLECTRLAGDFQRVQSNKLDAAGFGIFHVLALLPTHHWATGGSRVHTPFVHNLSVIASITLCLHCIGRIHIATHTNKGSSNATQSSLASQYIILYYGDRLRPRYTAPERHIHRTRFLSPLLHCLKRTGIVS